VGAVTITGITAVRTEGAVIRPSAGAVALQGYAPTKLIGIVKKPATGALNLEGHTPTINNPNWVIINTSQTPNWTSIVT
jgi:hypothetical protein